MGWLPVRGRYCSRLAGTLTLMMVRVDRPDLTKTAREPSRLKTTLLRRFPARKFVPRIVSVSPTPSVIGATDVIVGSLDFFFAADAVLAGSTARHSSTQSARIAGGHGGMHRSSGGARYALRPSRFAGRIAAQAHLRGSCSVQKESRTPHNFSKLFGTFGMSRTAQRVRPGCGRQSQRDCYERLAVQIGDLRDRGSAGFPPRSRPRASGAGYGWRRAHHSTAIEGNTLVLKQVELLLAEGRAVGNKELSEYLEVRGYANAADWVYGRGIQPDDLVRWRADLARRDPARARARDDARLGRRTAREATEREGPGRSASTTSSRSPEGCSRRRGPRSSALMRDWIRMPKASGRRRWSTSGSRSFTHGSSRSTRSSTATGEPGDCCSISCSSVWAIRRRSSTRAAGRATSRRSASRCGRCRAARRVPRRAPCSTTSTSSWCPPSPGGPACRASALSLMQSVSRRVGLPPAPRSPRPFSRASLVGRRRARQRPGPGAHPEREPSGTHRWYPGTQGICRAFATSGRRGSNPRPSAWEADALPTELRPRAAGF